MVSYDYAVRKEDSKHFHTMLAGCIKYSKAINARRGLLPTEPIIMALLLIQHNMIKKLLATIESARLGLNENCLKNCDNRNK